jgi:hypothetical protein
MPAVFAGPTFNPYLFRIWEIYDQPNMHSVLAESSYP